MTDSSVQLHVVELISFGWRVGRDFCQTRYMDALELVEDTLGNRGVHQIMKNLPNVQEIFIML